MSCVMWACAFMSHVSASCRIRMRYVTCDRVASHTKKKLMHHSFKTFVSQIYSQQAHHIWIQTSHMNGNIMYERVTSRVNESRDVRMSHVTFGGGMSRMSESIHVTYEWVMSCKSLVMNNVTDSYVTWLFICDRTHLNMRIHVTCEWVMSHLNESCHMWMSHVTFEWVMSCIVWTCAFMSHVNESCHIWMSHVTYEWVMSLMNESHDVWMSNVMYINEAHHIQMSHITSEWGMSHTQESCHTQRTYHSFKTVKLFSSKPAWSMGMCWQQFSKVSVIVILNSRFRGEWTFENVYLFVARFVKWRVGVLASTELGTHRLEIFHNLTSTVTHMHEWVTLANAQVTNWSESCASGPRTWCPPTREIAHNFTCCVTYMSEWVSHTCKCRGPELDAHWLERYFTHSWSRHAYKCGSMSAGVTLVNTERPPTRST